MSANNPYLDPELFQPILREYSPAANEEFLKKYSRDDYKLEIFIITVEIKHAKNLPKKDMLTGSSDPYCKLIAGDQTFQTQVINNNLNPEWNETFKFKSFQNPSKLRLEVYDYDKATDDDIIGYNEYDLNQLFIDNGNGNVNGNKKRRNKSKSFNGYFQLKRTKKGKLKVKINGRKLCPSLQKRIVESQQNEIKQQTEQLSNLKQENVTLMDENEHLKNPQITDKNSVKSLSSKPIISKQKKTYTRKSQHNHAQTSLLMTTWCMILKTVVYGLPFIGYYIDMLILCIGYILRLEMFVNGGKRKCETELETEKLLKLYEYEGNIKCKQVRETLGLLGLDYIVYPTFDNEKVPILVDENRDNKKIENSTEIISYLYAHYGQNYKKNQGRIQKLVQFVRNQSIALLVYDIFYLSLLRCLPEHGRKSVVKHSNDDIKLLELYSNEQDIGCIRIRELLSSLELAHIVRNGVGDNKKGKKLPVMIDANNSTKIEIVGDIEKIKQYLLNTYG